jgi:nitrogen fixation protein FixH
MSEATIKRPLNGWWVFSAFALFFGVIVIVNSVFITMALRTHSGVVTEDAYRKGLTYNEKLEQARNQPDIKSALHFENNILHWNIADQTGAAIENATVTANFMRPIKDGDDFNAELHHDGNGVYSIQPEFPVNGSWKVILSAKWDNNTYQTATALIVH